MIWQLRGEIAGQQRETKAVRLIGVTFFALAAYLAVTGARDLVTGTHPRASGPGLAIAAAALLVMPGLAVAKRRTGRALGNRTLVADSAETAFCAGTSAATLLGVGLNAWAAGGRPTRSPPWPSPPWRSRKASKPSTTTANGPGLGGSGHALTSGSAARCAVAAPKPTACDLRSGPVIAGIAT